MTDAEADAVARRLPLPSFRNVIDICCGRGRHAARLSERGYNVTGIDVDEDSLRLARERVPGASFERMDVRAVDGSGWRFDGAIILWQSFGYFAPNENDRVLTAIFSVLRPGGRLLLDVFHPEYFRRRQGARSTLPSGVRAIEDRFEGDRLHSEITYKDGSIDSMDFEIFAPDELASRARGAGFQLLEGCCWWDSARPPDPNQARYQLTLERSPA